MKFNEPLASNIHLDKVFEEKKLKWHKQRTKGFKIKPKYKKALEISIKRSKKI